MEKDDRFDVSDRLHPGGTQCTVGKHTGLENGHGLARSHLGEILCSCRVSRMEMDASAVRSFI